MVSFGNIQIGAATNCTAVYHGIGYTSFYNFITSEMEELYDSTGQEFLVGDPESYNPTPYVEITAPASAEILSFYSPSTYAEGESYQVNGTTYPVVNLQGKSFSNGWAAGVPITLYFIDNKLWWPFGTN